MIDKTIYIIGIATCIIIPVAVILIAGYFLLVLWCKFINQTYHVYKNHRLIKDWARQKDSFNKWKSDLDSFKALENFNIESVDFDMECGEIKRIYGYAKNIDEARKSMNNNDTFTIKSIPFIISYLDNSGRVEFTPVKYFRVEKS